MKSRHVWTLFGLALLVRLVTAALIPEPGYMDTAYYAADGLRLVAGRLETGDQFELGHFASLGNVCELGSRTIDSHPAVWRDSQRFLKAATSDGAQG